MRHLVAVIAAIALLGGGLAATDSPAHSAPGSLRTGWAPRPPTYPGTVVRNDLAIPMSDGTILRGDLTLPADRDGDAVQGRFPVIVTITAYNKSAQSSSGGLAGPAPSFL